MKGKDFDCILRRGVSERNTTEIRWVTTTKSPTETEHVPAVFDWFRTKIRTKFTSKLSALMCYSSFGAQICLNYSFHDNI